MTREPSPRLLLSTLRVVGEVGLWVIVTHQFRLRPGAQILTCPRSRKVSFLGCIRVPKVEVGGLGRSFSPQWGFLKSHPPPPLPWDKNTSLLNRLAVTFSLCMKAGGLCVWQKLAVYLHHTDCSLIWSAKNKQSSSFTKESSCALCWASA